MKKMLFLAYLVCAFHALAQEPLLLASQILALGKLPKEQLVTLLQNQEEIRVKLLLNLKNRLVLFGNSRIMSQDPTDKLIFTVAYWELILGTASSSAQKGSGHAAGDYAGEKKHLEYPNDFFNQLCQKAWQIVCKLNNDTLVIARNDAWSTAWDESFIAHSKSIWNASYNVMEKPLRNIIAMEKVFGFWPSPLDNGFSSIQKASKTAVMEALKKLDPLTHQATGRTAWQLGELFTLAYMAQDDFLEKNFVPFMAFLQQEFAKNSFLVPASDALAHLYEEGLNYHNCHNSAFLMVLKEALNTTYCIKTKGAHRDFKRLFDK